MGRPRSFDADQVALTVAGLVLQRGYDAVGVDDIVRVSGVGRGSLYQVFGSKAGLIARGLALAAEQDDGDTAALTGLVLASSGARDPLIAAELRRCLARLGPRPELAATLGRALLGRHPELLDPGPEPAGPTRKEM
jgi:TetR/AcrR family transcriptional regulator, transcriptional repressor for nem operon